MHMFGLRIASWDCSLYSGYKSPGNQIDTTGATVAYISSATLSNEPAALIGCRTNVGSFSQISTGTEPWQNFPRSADSP